MSDPIAIIGAGLSGIICARRLSDAGHNVRVFEKSRGLGGRLSTRHSRTGLTFDHGTPFVEADEEGFSAFLNDARAAAAAEPWDPLSGMAGFVGLPGMSNLVHPAASGLKIRLQTTVTGLTRNGGKWVLSTAETEPLGSFERCILTVPSFQAQTLLDGTGLDAPLNAVAMAPCWTLMAAFETPLPVGTVALHNPHPDLSWVIRDSAKPGREQTPDRWVVHSTPGWAQANLELERDAAGDCLMENLRETIGTPLPRSVFRAAHRWRYALTQTPLGRPYIATTDKTLFAGGDWTLGSRAGNAFQSGLAMAEAILAP